MAKIVHRIDTLTKVILNSEFECFNLLSILQGQLQSDLFSSYCGNREMLAFINLRNRH